MITYPYLMSMTLLRLGIFLTPLYSQPVSSSIGSPVDCIEVELRWQVYSNCRLKFLLFEISIYRHEAAFCIRNSLLNSSKKYWRKCCIAGQETGMEHAICHKISFDKHREPACIDDSNTSPFSLSPFSPLCSEVYPMRPKRSFSTYSLLMIGFALLST